MPLTITVDTVQSTKVIKLDGRIDGLTTPDFQTQVLELIESGDNHIVVDMSAVPYISSVGFRVFIIAQKKLSVHGQGGIIFLSTQKGDKFT